MRNSAIVAKGLHKSFGHERILEDLNLSVEEGELLVLMGPNGAGKSVLLSCLAGSEHPSDGSVEVLGAAATERNDTTSFLLQDALCLDRLTGRENIAFYSRLHPRFTDNWNDYVKRFEIASNLDRKVEVFSGGMKRKLELAIALSLDVPIYLLDEPTAALDLSVIQDVHSLLRNHQTAGKTVVITSHLPIDADIADRIAFLYNGRIITTGTPDELLNSLPPVLTTTDTHASRLAKIVVAGRLFEDDSRVRGFLSQDSKRNNIGTEEDAEGVSDYIDSDKIIETEPTYTDLFNYYTKLSPAAGEQPL